MQIYSDIIESFPQELQLPMLKLMDRLREETLGTVKKSDFEELKGVVTALGAHMSELALAQRELAEAQRDTEKTLRTVVKEQKKIRSDFGGLSDSIGYGLEDRAIRRLPDLLQRDLGLKIEALDRRFIEYPGGGDDEVNIYGEGLLNDEKVYIIGESKSQLGKRDVDHFRKFLARVYNHLGAKIIPILVTYSVRPKVGSYAKEKIKGLRLYMSFEL